MAILGQDAIESVSQAMFLTIPGKGLSEGDFYQSADLYRGIQAYVHLTGNPWVISGLKAGMLSAGYVQPMTLRWVGPVSPGDEIKIVNGDGEVVWHSIANVGNPEFDTSMRGETWKGVEIAVFDSGTLYIYRREGLRWDYGA